MESAIGKVGSIEGSVATVEVDSPVACRRCAEGRGCGAGIFESSDKIRIIRVQIPAGMLLRQGDPIELSIASKFLLRAAMLAYGLPLLAMVLFPGLGWLLTGEVGDVAGVVLAVLGLLSGLVIGRQILRKESICEQFVPSVGHGSSDGFH
jgi:sigma-E factor negative regulatory protein RseC